MGVNCEQCLPAFNAKPWARGVNATTANACVSSLFTGFSLSSYEQTTFYVRFYCAYRILIYSRFLASVTGIPTHAFITFRWTPTPCRGPTAAAANVLPAEITRYIHGGRLLTIRPARFAIHVCLTSTATST